MVVMREYNYATIRITEHFDEIKEGNVIHNRNRFWVVTIDKQTIKTSLRCDSTAEALDFIRENIYLVKDQKVKK